MRKLDIAEKEQMDVEAWRINEHESPESDSIHNIINKMTDVPNLLECVGPFDAEFRAASSVLELGGGQGWSSCVLKRLYPQARFTVSDISEYAVASVPKWEKMLGAVTEPPIACRSYDIPVADETFDCVFVYSAAHHFGAHRRTLKELRRVLKPGGHVFYLHEPSCRRWIYKRAHARVNHPKYRGDGVAEDVLVYPKLLKIAREEGFAAEFRFTPTLNKRGPRQLAYYSVLRALPFLQRILPCTGTFHFVKN